MVPAGQAVEDDDRSENGASEGGRVATFAAGEDEGDGAAIPLAVEVELIGEAAA